MSHGTAHNTEQQLEDEWSVSAYDVQEIDVMNGSLKNMHGYFLTIHKKIDS